MSDQDPDEFDDDPDPDDVLELSEKVVDMRHRTNSLSPLTQKLRNNEDDNDVSSEDYQLETIDDEITFSAVSLTHLT